MCGPVAWSVATMRTVLVDGKFVTPTADRLNRKAFCVADFVAGMRFERMSSAYEADVEPNSTNPLCAWFSGLGNQAKPSTGMFIPARRDGVTITRIPHNGRWGGYLTSHALPAAR